MGTCCRRINLSCCSLSDSSLSGLPYDSVLVKSTLRPVERGIDWGNEKSDPLLIKQRERRTGGEKEKRREIEFQTDGGVSRLRPETVESLFYMFTRTRDVGYLHCGRRLFDAMVTYAKAPNGYSKTRGISTSYPIKTGKWESWVLAETFKYFYFLFSDPDSDTVNIAGKEVVVKNITQDFIFTTEAHLVPRWK